MLLLLSSTPVERGELRLMRSVLISLQRVQAASFTKQESLDLPPGARPSLYCSNKCTLRDWCQLWCAYPSNTPTYCLVSNITVVPTYQETNMADALTCHTTRPKDLATNANITAGKQYMLYPLRVRVSNVTAVTPLEDFAAYDLFGEFPGRASAGQVVEMKSPYDHPFQVCHIEVF
ncbi:hypothetical protein Pcinc_003929 [Petrolisthes cinctipes]|uniref:Uncharacterized protein n=1 Tax=Petrolisthes cinctipes TaxID=88211 RepID=A0AAE1L480_PETCI|nr:hypothetical protein Pcinc_032669 [Petrolisthes cinctipes]KAK3879581.1 hypothetical protein Pcinc_015868 [Petrolisthes cinctipes]KAK3892225.1 hypothetical protein Pcinc_003929 [Petrolisthes cinctipes]